MGNVAFNRLGEIVSISKGKKPGIVFENPTVHSKRFIQIDDLRNDSTLKYTEENGVEVRVDDVIIAWDGANAGTIGFNLEGNIGSTLARLRIQKKDIAPNFLGWLLRSKFRYLRDHCTGATIPHISKQILEGIKVPIYPIHQQQKIASILSQVDAAREKRKQANAITEQFLQSTFLHLFGDPVKNEKGWEQAEIETHFKVETGSTPARNNSSFYDGTIAWVKTGEVVGNIILETSEKISKEGLEQSNCKIFPKGTILLAMYGQGLTRGRTAMLGIEATTNQACAAILPNSSFSMDFIWVYLKMSYEALRNLGRGGNQPNLNLSMVKSFKIFIPPLTLQQKFADIVAQTEQLRIKQRQSERELEQLFQSLLQRYFG